ncbi:MAG: FeoB-associated Cys-rich membrane protein [Capnocytophaga sp.]|nr:FeoB-associated Cys-rich membrane protein [Capnocytophaga sp.]
MIQDILAYGLVGIAALFLIKKYFFKSKKKCGGTDCNCG